MYWLVLTKVIVYEHSHQIHHHHLIKKVVKTQLIPSIEEKRININ